MFAHRLDSRVSSSSDGRPSAIESLKELRVAHRRAIGASAARRHANVSQILRSPQLGAFRVHDVIGGLRTLHLHAGATIPSGNVEKRREPDHCALPGRRTQTASARSAEQMRRLELWKNRAALRLAHILQRRALARDGSSARLIGAIGGQPKHLPESQVVVVQRKPSRIVAIAAVGLRVNVIGVVEGGGSHAHLNRGDREKPGSLSSTSAPNAAAIGMADGVLHAIFDEVRRIEPIGDGSAQLTRLISSFMARSRTSPLALALALGRLSAGAQSQRGSRLRASAQQPSSEHFTCAAPGIRWAGPGTAAGPANAAFF